MPQNVFTITETGVVASQLAAQNPMEFLTWGMQAASTMAEMAASVTKQVLKETEKPKQNPQP